MDLSDIVTESQLEQIIDEEIEAVLEKRKKKNLNARRLVPNQAKKLLYTTGLNVKRSER